MEKEIITYGKFEKRIVEMAENKFKAHPAKRKKKYLIDSNLGDVLEDLHRYLTLNESFEAFKDEDGRERSLYKGIALWGNIGVGKSFLMELLANNSYRPFYFRCSSKVASDYKKYGESVIDTYTDESFYTMLDKTSGAEIYNISKPKTYLFDDIGTEVSTSSHYKNSEQVISRIIFDRNKLWNNHAMITHFTFNMSPDVFRKTYGEKLFDRIREMCNFVLLDGKTSKR